MFMNTKRESSTPFAVAVLGAMLLSTGVASAQAPNKKAVQHNATMTGAGTVASPLSVTVPLSLSGSTAQGTAVVTGTNPSAGNGLRGTSATGAGVVGDATGTNGIGVGGIGPQYGVIGVSTSGNGVAGIASGSVAAVYGFHEAANRIAVYGESNIGVGSVGLWGQSRDGFAGIFLGDVEITGNLFKTASASKIDHPLDPSNKYLTLATVESPDMMTVFNGNATTDADGVAVVDLPEYFAALNRDFRYQLTVVGQFAQAIVGSKISENRFSIRTDKPNVEVSWQVTGVRQDAWAADHRIQVEQDKSDQERGYFLNPELYGYGEERSVRWARHPEMMKMSREAQSTSRVKALMSAPE
jgi:trimeric autotransporter adhesin